jgi:hypothetical protein
MSLPQLRRDIDRVAATRNDGVNIPAGLSDEA